MRPTDNSSPAPARRACLHFFKLNYSPADYGLPAIMREDKGETCFRRSYLSLSFSLSFPPALFVYPSESHSRLHCLFINVNSTATATTATTKRTRQTTAAAQSYIGGNSLEVNTAQLLRATNEAGRQQLKVAPNEWLHCAACPSLSQALSSPTNSPYLSPARP